MPTDAYAMRAEYGAGPDGRTCASCAYLEPTVRASRPSPMSRQLPLTTFVCRHVSPQGEAGTPWSVAWPVCALFRPA